jgi:hypothetical protein
LGEPETASMPISQWTAASKLLAALMLAVGGAVAGTTAATLYAAEAPERALARRARRDSATTGWPEGNRTPIPTAQLYSPSARRASAATWRGLSALLDSLHSSHGVVHVGVDAGGRALPLPSSSVSVDSVGTPELSYSAIRRWHLAQTALADSALVHGNADSAIHVAREMLWRGAPLLHAAHTVHALVGIAMVRGSAALLQRSARQADSLVLNEQAKRVLGLIDSHRQRVLTFAHPAALVFAKPSDAETLASDVALPPSERAAALDIVLGGVCHAPREMIFGPSTEREEQLERVANALSDLPSAAPSIARARSMLARLEHPPITQRRARSTAFESVSRLLVPERVVSRVEMCPG